MSFTKFLDDIAYISKLSDKPNLNDDLTPTQLKDKFDKAGLDLQDYINDTFIAELEAVTDGSSGADKIGATGIADLTGTTVQAILESMKSYIDSEISETESNVYTKTEVDSIDNNLQGQIDSNDSDISTVQSRLDTNESDIDSLQSADAQNVKKTGNQSISGTKTFNSNIVVPETPTIDTHATSKSYVDSQSPLTIENGSITDLKLSNADGEIKDRLEDINTIEND